MSHHVDGREYAGSHRWVTDLIDPVSEDTFAQAPIGSAEDVGEAVRSATKGYQAWKETPAAERSARLHALADLIARDAEALADDECRMTGKRRDLWVGIELEHSIDVLRFSAGAARCLTGPAAADYVPGMTSWLRRDPLGVVIAIVPWNFPLMMALWKVAPILAAGNSCVLKPSEATPLTALRLARLATEAGIPDGVLNVICGDASTGRHLVAHPTPAMVAFTGSVSSGRQVAISAAESIKRLQLELGGKAPALVLDDLAKDSTRLDSALRGIHGAAMFNAGQSCTAATRVIATGAVYDAVTEGLAALAQSGPTSFDYYGPLISRRHFERVAGLVAERGGHRQLMAGGHRLGDRGFFYAPTVIAEVREDDRLLDEEIFGPVITVERAHDADDAARRANNSRYGLAASVWTDDHPSALRLSRQLQAGDIWINTHGFQAVEMPHGGTKQSGYGSDLSIQSVVDYTRPVHVASQWRQGG